MTIEPEAIQGVRVVALKSHPDERGRFLETFRQEWFPGRPVMVQGNRSDSKEGVLRGLHFHRKQADYWVAEQSARARRRDRGAGLQPC